MNIKNLESYCNLMHISFHFPLYIYKNKSLHKSYSINNLINPSNFMLNKFIDGTMNPSYYISDSFAQYGLIHVSKNIDLIIGPIYSDFPDERVISQFVVEHALNPNSDLTNYLQSLTRYNYHDFLNLLAFMFFTITGISINIIEHFNLRNKEVSDNILQDLLSKYNYLEDQVSHGTYNFERQLIDLVKYGNTTQLNDFIMSQFQLGTMLEGKLADNPLRQAKNIFIGTVTMIGKEGAIPGGVGVEETYRLIDSYIQHCERLTSINQIKTLQYNMLIDFTNRVSQGMKTNKISPDTVKIIDYIQTRILEKIHIHEIADHLERSESYITSRFKEDTGVTIGTYINDKKLELSKNLLQYSSKTLVEISTYLSYSSQSYFQNCFKKKYNITPLKFRKNSRYFQSTVDA